MNLLSPQSKLSAAVLSLALGAISCEALAQETPAEDTPAPPAAQSSAMRTFVQVSDLERSLAFYRDLLGFELLLTAEYDSDRMRKFLQVEKTVIPTVAVMSSDGKAITFSLVSAPETQVDASANRKNAPILIVDRNDVPAIHTAAVAANFTVIFEPEESRNEENTLIARELGLVDPDGNRVLVLEKF